MNADQIPYDLEEILKIKPQSFDAKDFKAVLAERFSGDTVAYVLALHTLGGETYVYFCADGGDDGWDEETEVYTEHFDSLNDFQYCDVRSFFFGDLIQQLKPLMKRKSAKEQRIEKLEATLADLLMHMPIFINNAHQRSLDWVGFGNCTDLAVVDLQKKLAEARKILHEE